MNAQAQKRPPENRSDRELLQMVLGTIGVLPETKRTVAGLVNALLSGEEPNPKHARALTASSEVAAAVAGFIDGSIE